MIIVFFFTLMKFKTLITTKELKIYFTNSASPISNLYSNNTEVVAYETTIRIISIQ